MLRRGRPAAVASAAVAVLLAGAATLALTGGDEGGADGGGDGGGAAGSSTDPALRFAECMRDNGIQDFPDPRPSDDGGISIGDAVADQRDTEEFAAAEEACQPILDAAPGPETQRLPPAERAALQGQWDAVARCVREQGHDFPTPEVDEWGRAPMDDADAAVGQAIEECTDRPAPTSPG